MRTYTILTAILIALLFSCSVKSKKKEARMDKAWFFSEMNLSAEKPAKYKPDKKDFFLYRESFLDLQEDGSYTSYFGEFDKGKWKIRKKKLILYNIKQDLEFDIVSLTANKLKLYYAPRNTEYVFDGFDNRFASADDNPFSPVYHKWRIKARKKETDEEIDARLKNHLLFQQKYFTWGFKNGDEGLVVNAIPSPVTIYGNGFQLRHEGEQPFEWKDLFYDSLDCRRAYERLYYVFAYNKVNFPKTDNDFELLASAFKQVRQHFELTPWIKPGKEK